MFHINFSILFNDPNIRNVGQAAVGSTPLFELLKFQYFIELPELLSEEKQNANQTLAILAKDQNFNCVYLISIVLSENLRVSVNFHLFKRTCRFKTLRPRIDRLLEMLFGFEKLQYVEEYLVRARAPSIRILIMHYYVFILLDLKTR